VSKPEIKLCFVCLGNICRSPTAEGVMQHLIDQAGLSKRIEIDSAGTGAYHVGERADPRSRSEAMRRGVELASRARQFVVEDFDNFDYVLAMDRANHRDLEEMAMGPQHLAKLHLLRSFDAAAGRDLDVPDPYYGGDGGFARVYDICLAGCTGLLAYIREQHDL
jgi:protein-tyrosine phosphatase